MAIKNVRALIFGQWRDLTYNFATRNYEISVTPNSTSFHQANGYFWVTVEATGDDGLTDTMSGVYKSSLRLYVKEEKAPIITLVSPPEGFLTTHSPTIVFKATDEEGGSGIDPGSAVATVDPNSAIATVDGSSCSCTVTATADGYLITVQPDHLSEGPHVIAVTIRDNDGNTGGALASYTIDTIPPELKLEISKRVIIDDFEIAVSGYVSDAMSEPVSVVIDTTPATVSEGKFSAIVPLEIGENYVNVKATDTAGNEKVESLYYIRMVTDRTQRDLDSIKTQLKKPYSEWSSAELSEFNKSRAKGAYNYTDLNRVCTAVDWLKNWMYDNGYAPDIQGKRNWALNYIPRQNEIDRYIKDVQQIREQFSIELPVVDVQGNMTLQKANDIESILVAVNAVIPYAEISFFGSGEIGCGEF